VNLKMLKMACTGRCDRGKFDLVKFPVAYLPTMPIAAVEGHIMC
jgi:hypothetical protein